MGQTVIKVTEFLDGNFLLGEFLHQAGRHLGVLSDHELDCCWALGDGYGEMSIAALRGRGLVRDWSHIRDASVAAKCRIAEFVRRSILQRGATERHDYTSAEGPTLAIPDLSAVVAAAAKARA